MFTTAAMKFTAALKAKFKLIYEYYSKNDDQNIFSFYENYLEQSGILTPRTTVKFVAFMIAAWFFTLGSIMEIADSLGELLNFLYTRYKIN